MKKVKFDMSKNQTKIISNRYDQYSELENSIIENINNILDYCDLPDNDLPNNNYSSDEEYESNENIEDFEGTFYDSKFNDTKNKLKEYNILVKNKSYNYIIIMNNKEYNLNMIEELYEFENYFYKYLNEKNIYKKKNKKNKKKYNESLKIFLNKYDVFREELENILKFNIQENTKHKETNDDDDLINQMIEKNIKYIKDKLDNTISHFKTLINNDLNIIYKYETIFLKINKYYDKYIEYNNQFKEDDSYVKTLHEINQIYYQNKFLHLVKTFKDYKILYTPKYLHNLSCINEIKFKIKYDIDNKTYDQANKKFKLDINNYNLNYTNLIHFYQKIDIIKNKDNIKIIDQCNKRFSYFNDAIIDKKNDYINNIYYNFNEYFSYKNNFNFSEVSQNYLDYIFDLPDIFFSNNKYNIKKLEDDFYKLFSKYDITLEEHIIFLDEIPDFFNKKINKRKK
jgi:hypothetical protein